jgi:hypothetical protein
MVIFMTLPFCWRTIGRRSFFLICTLFASSKLCLAVVGEGTIDTIRISRWEQASVAYHDSIVIYEQQPNVANPTARGFTRSSPAAPWDSVELVSSWFRQLPMKGCVMLGLSEKRNEYGLHWILRDAKTVRIDTTGRESDKITYQPIKRMRVHPANPRKVYIQYEYTSFGATYTATMVTNDDGDTWSEINPPTLSGDAGRGHSLGFNYREPLRTYLAVDPQNNASPNEPFRAYYTDDDGITFTQVDFSPEVSAPLWELGVGIWSEDRGIDFAYFGGKQRIFLPVDSVGENGHRTTVHKELLWLDRVRVTMFPNFDSTTQRLDYAYRYTLKRDGHIDGFAFHPELPESFALAFKLDTLIANKWHSRVFVVATMDMGKTWNVIVPMTDLRKVTYQYPSSLNFDPSSKALYCSYQEARYDSVTGETEYLNSYTIKWTPDLTSLVDGAITEDSSENILVYPNPAPRDGSITFRLPPIASFSSDESPVVTFVSLDGRSSAAKVFKDEVLFEPTNMGRHRVLSVMINHLVPGVYTAVVSEGSYRQACLVIVDS